MSAKKQPDTARLFSGLNNVTQFGVAQPMTSAVQDKFTDQSMFSCGSLAPKLRSGCMDHSFTRCGFVRARKLKIPPETSHVCPGFGRLSALWLKSSAITYTEEYHRVCTDYLHQRRCGHVRVCAVTFEGVFREKEPWEISDGALWLLKELAPEFPDLVTASLSDAGELARLRHFDKFHKLHETLWTVLPGIAQGLGKKPFKPFLELFLDEMFRDLHSDNQLCQAAAGGCVGFFRDWLGPSIFRGRLNDEQCRLLDNCDSIPHRVHIPEVRTSHACGSSKPCGLPGSEQRVSLAERMRALPPGSGIPNLLS